MEEYVEKQKSRYKSQQSTSTEVQLVKAHILPYAQDLETPARASACLAILRPKMGTELREAMVLSGGSFVVVKTEPDSGGLVTSDTELYFEGPFVPRLSKLQLMIPLPAGATTPDHDTLASAMFAEHVGPFLQSVTRRPESVYLVNVGNPLAIDGTSYIVSATEPTSNPGQLVAVDTETLIFVGVDACEEFSRIHVVPFQDTLPRAYEFDLFTDYLRPFFTSNPLRRFQVDQQFSFRGVQFRVVAVEPSGDPARRVGRQTVIYCEGVLHPALRNVLPQELMDQLALLPPGLQLLLLNTDALAGLDVYERMIGLQETLTARRGLSDETINMLPTEGWQPGVGSSSDEQCMICLAEFTTTDQVRRLPCHHVYHCPCIDEWLRRCTDCPLCKANVDRALRGY